LEKQGKNGQGKLSPPPSELFAFPNREQAAAAVLGLEGPKGWDVAAGERQCYGIIVAKGSCIAS
jgi:hypothetical protein